MKNIILIGMMGCGKTTCGGLLSRRLDRELVDTDALIAAREGRSIPEIFAAQGEDRFRELERGVAEELARREGRPAAAIDAIALVESGAGEKCDAVVSVLAPEPLRVKRIMARDGIDEAYALRRVRAQPSNEFFRSHSDYVLENTEMDTPETFASRAKALFEQLL